MNIGYILGVFPKLSETFIINEIVELIERDHNVYIFSIFRPKEKVTQPEVDEYKLLDRTYYTPSNFKLLSHLTDSYQYTQYKGEFNINKIYCIAAANFFSDIIKTLELDILHAHFANEPAFTAMIVSKITGIPFTFTVHAFDIFIHPNKDALKERMLLASAVISISEYNKNYLRDLVEIDVNKIHVIRACPNTDKLLELLRLKNVGEMSTILTIARLVEKKGVKYAILAIKDLVKFYPELQYRIIGTGPLEGELMGLSKSLKLENNVVFLGALDGTSLENKLINATIFVLPCVHSDNGDMDGIPVSLMEAMSLKIPVVSTDISGIPELIENRKDGILVEEKNSEQLANAIRVLLDDEDLRLKISTEGLQKINNEFNIHHEIEKLLNVWVAIMR